MDGYSLSRAFTNFAFENPEKINPTHYAIFFFAVEQWNRFGQKEKFGFPSYFCMSAIGVKSKNTFYKCFNDLIEFGLIKIITKSQNQNTANIISLTQNMSQHEYSTNTALDMANIQHVSQHEYSGGTIDKQRNKETKKQDNINEISNEISKPQKKDLVKEVENILNSDFLENIKEKFGFDDEEIKSIAEDFLFYWKEKNDNGKKELWEMKKTFDVKMRFYTWIKKQKEWGGKKTSGKIARVTSAF